MLIKEILDSVEVIPDTYIKSVTYAKIAEKLSKIGHPSAREAFLLAIETAREIDDPFRMFRALLSVGHSMAKAGLKSSKRVYSSVREDSRILHSAQRDVLMKTAVSYMLSLGEISEAITYALEIEDRTMRNEVLLEIIRVNTGLIGKDNLKAASRIRKSKLALEYLNIEPYRSEGIRELIRSYLHLQTYENAISLLREMSNKEVALQTFKEVVFYLKDIGALGHYIDSIENVARELIEKFGKEFRYELAFALSLVGEGITSVKMLRELDNPEELLVKMALEILNRDHNSLPALIEALTEDEATLVGKEVLNAILRNPRPNLRDVVDAIGKSTSSEEVWAKIARYYVLIGDVETAMRIGTLLKDQRLKSIVMADVAHHLLKKGEIERAIDAALEVKDSRFSSLLVSEILLNALERESKGRVKSWSGSRR